MIVGHSAHAPHVTVNNVGSKCGDNKSQRVQLYFISILNNIRNWTAGPRIIMLGYIYFVAMEIRSG